ncbi:gliding motility-associated C-terminal domain-containing protein [Pseudoflavitalea rhizosphaerae]|uniref:T9SS type B sorting domain-containing protein n=1 Tax=Pseudoflavitalea rhizosphaerae TaxID=1884793 RepID=UPI000F8E1E7B|nr:gliding motility-associated C-terminal domain-containing protein [Pseudoflavitalea rhizosphaerae]
MKYCLLQLCFYVSIMLPAKARQEASHWYFGYHAGIQFTDGGPGPVTGSLSGWEGCSAISDVNGNLLFYSDGMQVWNRQHRQMPNGSALLGDTLSTQSALITQWPGSDSLYYLFTVDKEGGNNGLVYSVIDMSLDDGLGDIIPGRKNIRLTGPVCEKIAAVKKNNANDLWLIAARYGTDELLVYLIDCRGIQSSPQIFRSGLVISQLSEAIGYLKASPDGRWLALASFTSSAIVLDFDIHTGAISRPRTVYANPNRIAGPYGLEFSRDGRFLYMSESYNNSGSGAYYVSQYELESTSVEASRVPVDSGYSHTAGAIQAAPDGNLYIAYDGMDYLGAITHPERKGLACGFQKEYFRLAPGSLSGVGLPSFVAGYQKRLLPADTTICEGAFLQVLLDVPGENVLWQNGAAHTSYTLSEPGMYWVQVSNQYCRYSDSLLLGLTLKPAPVLKRGLTICPGQQILLHAGTIGDNYRWQDGNTQAVYVVTAPGTYRITVTNSCGSGQDETVVARGGCMLAIPNAFTPAKNTNNLFRLVNGHLAEKFTMQLFNRWGQLVFRTNDPLAGWDGRISGIDQPAGSYVYQISYTVRSTGQAESHTGVMLLIR